MTMLLSSFTVLHVTTFYCSYLDLHLMKVAVEHIYITFYLRGKRIETRVP